MGSLVRWFPLKTYLMTVSLTNKKALPGGKAKLCRENRKIMVDDLKLCSII